MGLRAEIIKFILDNTPVFKMKMLEFGNQRIRENVETEFETGKEYFGALGCYHLSIDFNGKDGAMIYDLRDKISNFNDEFDIVTNIAVTNYIKKYEGCYDNIYRFCKYGGIMIHVLPEKGSKWSASHYGSTVFFNNLVQKYNFCKIKAIRKFEGDLGNLIMAAIIK